MLGAFLIPQVPDRHDVGAVHDMAGSFLDRFLIVQQRIVSRLTEISEQVESAVGLKPLVASETA